MNAYESIKAFSETDFTEDLKKIDVPTLVLHGEDDQIVPVKDSAHKSAQLIADATEIYYPGAPHGLTDTHADQFNADLLAFLRSDRRFRGPVPACVSTQERWPDRSSSSQPTGSIRVRRAWPAGKFARVAGPRAFVNPTIRRPSMPSNPTPTDALAGKLKRTELQHKPLLDSRPGDRAGTHRDPGRRPVGLAHASRRRGRLHPRRDSEDGDPGSAHPHPTRRGRFLMPPRTPHNATDLGPDTGQMLSTYIVEIGESLAEFTR